MTSSCQPPSTSLRLNKLRPELGELRLVFEALVATIATWFIIGWSLRTPIIQADGSVLVLPYLRSTLEASGDWSQHLYRFGVVGGSKMHEFGGTLPIVQLCAVLGLSPTTCSNVIVLFEQLCLGYLGLKTTQAVVLEWSEGARTLTVVERIATILAVAFAPLIGWRLAYGHDNLVLGLLPVFAALSLVCAARIKSLSITHAAVATLAIANGVTGLGAQTAFYSVVFVAPLVLVFLLGKRDGLRWSRSRTHAVIVVLAGLLLVLSRLWPMITHASSDDASRGLSEDVMFSFGQARAIDWLTSIPWTTELARSWSGGDSLHEHNYPLGPLLLLFACWPWTRSRGALIALAGSTVVAILFASNVGPVPSLLRTIVPPLAAFRVPARAVLPLFAFVPVLTLAAAFAATRASVGRRRWLEAGIALVVLACGRFIPEIACEIAAWGVAGAFVVLRKKHSMAWAIPVVVALGVTSFTTRFPTGFPTADPDGDPRAVRQLVYTSAPELRNSQLDRVEVVDAPLPFQMSFGWAAGLSSLDGVWYPPRRFLELLGALRGKPVPSTMCLFDFAHWKTFDLLQQLYNVRVRVAHTPSGWKLQPLPETPGPAWFPTQLVTITDPAQMGASLRSPAAPVRIRTMAWVLARDHVTATIEPACQDARVEAAGTDALGQRAELEVHSPANCLLVVATNYVSTFRATVDVNGETRPAAVIPIDIALTGIQVPPGATRIRLAPVVESPGWTLVAALVGLVALLASCIAIVRQRAS